MRNKLRMAFRIAVAGTAILSLPPPTASAGGPHVDPAGSLFFAEEGTFTISASNEPTITCTGKQLFVGRFDAESSTSGEGEIDLTNCHTGFGTKSCRTPGSPLPNTVRFTPFRFHTVYTTAGTTKPGILLTLPAVTITCEGAFPFEMTGGLMGTITAPACGKTASTASMSFTATGFTQNQMQITGTGTAYDLQVRTGGGIWKTAAVTTSTTVIFKEAITLTCI
jgi:hypothetical protein